MCALGSSSVARHYPKGWSGEQVSADCSRFGARFRVAKAFEKVTFLPGIAADTASGYSKIFHVFLAYTAYEKFEKTFGLTSSKKRAEIEAKYSSTQLYADLAAYAEACPEFVAFLKKKSDRDPQKENLDALREKKAFSIIFLGESIRHCFAHGSLTPNAWGAKPTKVALFCGSIADFLVSAMDAESKPRIDGFKKRKKPS